MKWSEIFLRYLEKNFEIFRKKIVNFRKHIRRFFVIFVSRPRSALKRFIKICVRRPSVRSEQIKIFIETFLECSSRYTLKELSLFIAFLKTTSKLITFSQRSIKLLVGILFDFFTPAKLTEIQRRISCGHTTDFYLGKPFLPRANSSKIYLGKFIWGFVLPR